MVMHCELRESTIIMKLQVLFKPCARHLNNILRNGRRAGSSGAASPISATVQTPMTTHSPGSPASYFSNIPASPGASTPIASSPSSDTANRKSGIFGRKKSISHLKAPDAAQTQTEAGGKLPKEILANGFWEVLGNKGGDPMWRSSTFSSSLS